MGLPWKTEEAVLEASLPWKPEDIQVEGEDWRSFEETEADLTFTSPLYRPGRGWATIVCGIAKPI